MLSDYDKSKLPLLEIKTLIGSTIIQASDILYIEGRDKHSVVYLANKHSTETKHALKWYEEKLPEPFFYRCHDSFIVNCLYFEAKSYDKLLLHKNIYVRLGRNKKNGFKENLEKLYNLINNTPANHE